jgi:hypothetical protein
MKGELSGGAAQKSIEGGAGAAPQAAAQQPTGEVQQ